MGQRSQIYIAFNERDMSRTDKLLSPNSAREAEEEILIARYYQWNFGSRMVSRAAGLMNWLECNKDYLDWKEEEIIRIADTNFDFKDVVISQDIIKEAEEYYDYGCKTPNEFIFDCQDNNDGKLFIKVEPDGAIKYAFTDGDISKVMTAEEYMEWGEYKTEEDVPSHYSENLITINDLGTLMTDEELNKFMETDYKNLSHISVEAEAEQDIER